MYSVVLVAALVTTSATPNWHNRCGGCYAACSSCYGSGYGGYSGHSGYAGYPGYQPYTCHAGGGCYRTIPGYNGGNGGYGWAGGCYGYHGGCYGAGYGATSYGAGYAPTVYGAYYIDPSQTYGQGCYGCYGGYAGYGIPVPPVVLPPAPNGSEGVKDPFPPINPDPKKVKKGEEIAPPKEKKVVDPKKELEKLSRATIRLEIPEGGKLFVDGRPIAVTAGTRQFETPPLAAGQQFYYDFRVEVTVNGEIRREERRVVIQANQDVAVDFPNLSRAAAIANR